MIASVIIEDINYLCYIAVIVYRNYLASVRVSLYEINYKGYVMILQSRLVFLGLLNNVQ